MKSIERLFKYLEAKGIKHTRAEKDWGLSNGYLNTQLKRNADLGESALRTIIDNCLDLSPEWLLLGRGEMLVETIVDTKNETLPSEHLEDVHLNHTPNRTPISKSKNLGVQNGDKIIPLSGDENVDPIGRPKSRPISKSENLGVQKSDNDNILVEIVDVRAAANVQGLSMTDGYVESLGVLPVPRSLISRTRGSNKNYLWFPIIGDSMEPTIYIDDYVLASQIVDYSAIRDNYIYIISTRENGILIKRVLNRLEVRGQLYARSDNRSYSAFNIDGSDIVSIWEARARLSFKFPNEQIDLYNAIQDLQARVEQIEVQSSKKPIRK